MAITVERRALVLLWLNIALQAVDGVLTYFLLHHGGAEVNPLITGMFPVLGIAATLMTVKGLGGVLALLLWHRHRGSQGSVHLLFALAGLMDAVVSWNLVMMLVA